MATSRSPSVTLASANATLLPPPTTSAEQTSVAPGRTAATKLTFISTLAVNTLRPLAHVTVAAPIAESQNAPRKPPCSTPAGFTNRSSTCMRQRVRPGTDLSSHTMPSVRSQFGGTCKAVTAPTVAAPTVAA